ncbi:FAD binding domain-containing protein [Promicromonospora panici]|uniref:FAD binding domain-containing protein n=1 Tax=Promicromonospora panici TaxID=2219658 RepID=UPI00101B7904|nr:FAD binding domain-containing protein [Promicromonospora panici]
MDIDIDTVRVARSRADCVLRPGEAFLGGGTFLYSEPVPAGVTGLVDLTGMGWEPWSVDGAGLRVAGTCTLEELLAGPGRLGASSDGPYRGLGIVGECVSALTLSGKVARTATVGGNLALGLPAGSMVGLFAALSAVAVVWTPEASTGSSQPAGSREVAVADLVTGAGRVGLAPGEVLREVRVPAAVLGQRTMFRRASLTPTGRTAAMVTGRAGEPAPRITVTASVSAPLSLHARDHDMLDRWIDWIGSTGAWYEDTHGSREWRAAMTRRLAHEALEELGGAA